MIPRTFRRRAASLLLVSLPGLGGCNVVSRTWTMDGPERVERSFEASAYEGSRSVRDGALTIEVRDVRIERVQRFRPTVERTLQYGYPTDLTAVLLGDFFIVPEVLVNWVSISDSDEVFLGPIGYLLSILPFVSADTGIHTPKPETDVVLGERLVDTKKEETKRPAAGLEVVVACGEARVTARTGEDGRARVPLADIARAVVAKGATDDPVLTVTAGDVALGDPMRLRLDDLLAALSGG